MADTSVSNVHCGEMKRGEFFARQNWTFFFNSGEDSPRFTSLQCTLLTLVSATVLPSINTMFSQSETLVTLFIETLRDTKIEREGSASVAEIMN